MVWELGGWREHKMAGKLEHRARYPKEERNRFREEGIQKDELNGKE
jgi:hypothetical protein